jgi:ATP-dependent Clp protease ATP-binding subunit ClpC
MRADEMGHVEGPLSLALEIAEAECQQLRHERVDSGHLLLGLLIAHPEPMQRLLAPFGLRRIDLIEALRAAMPQQPADTAAPADPMPSSELLDVIRSAEQLATGSAVELEHALIAVLRQATNLPRRVLLSFGVDLKRLEVGALARLAASREGEAPAPRAKRRGTDGPKASNDRDGRDGRAAAKSAPRESVIEQLTRDLVAMARDGEFDEVIGREREIESVLEILARRNKNNPVLLGEPGVGKSAIVEGLAQRIARGGVPSRLKDLRIRELGAADLVAGTQYRGDFEQRILKLVEETSEDPNVVLFIDEIHTILASGGQQGTGDAASLLKPHLARGDVRCIGATTHDEYRKFIEKDRALARRFQPVLVPEPSIDDCRKILTSVRTRLESHHGLKIGDDALEAAMSLSVRYLQERHLPDKAIDLLDQAAARKSLRQPDDPNALVAAHDVLGLLRDQLGKNLGELTLDESKKLLGIEEFLKHRVIGQDHAAERVAERIRLAKREFDFRPERPNGVFLFLGPTGVGKTEIARCLAEYLLASRDAMIRYDLSEFTEAHSISKLIGSPPGYVGYDEEGHQLTSRIRTRPQTILLLDEIEKAHPAVLNLFLQVFEDGRLTDSHGRTVSFSEVTIILTSNIGADAFRRRDSIGFTPLRDLAPEEVREQARALLENRLPLELINRVDEVVIFNSLTREAILEIARNLVERAILRFHRENKSVEVEESAVKFLADTGYDEIYGARHLQRNVEQLLLQPLARETYLSDWNLVHKIKVRKAGSGLVFEKLHRKGPRAARGVSQESAEPAPETPETPEAQGSPDAKSR